MHAVCVRSIPYSSLCLYTINPFIYRNIACIRVYARINERNKPANTIDWPTGRPNIQPHQVATQLKLGHRLGLNASHFSSALDTERGGGRERVSPQLVLEVVLVLLRLLLARIVYDMLFGAAKWTWPAAWLPSASMHVYINNLLMYVLVLHPSHSIYPIRF